MSREVAESYGKRIEAIIEKLARKKDCPPDSFEVKELVGEYGFVIKQFTEIKGESEMMKHLAQFQNSEPTKLKTDRQHGRGTAEFIAQAIWASYGKLDIGYN